MKTVIVPKQFIKGQEFIAVPRKEYEEFSYWQKSFKTKGAVTERDVSRWSKESRFLKKKGKLPLLKSLRDFC